jgi:hypothetical protein
MNIDTFNNYRLAFILQGCRHCRQLCEFIERINTKLPIQKRIRIIDCTRFQEFGIADNPLISLFSKSFDGYPTVFISGLRISGSNTRLEIETYLTTLLQAEFTNIESNDFTFEKECEIKKVLGFKRVVCK